MNVFFKEYSLKKSLLSVFLQVSEATQSTKGLASLS